MTKRLFIGGSVHGTKIDIPEKAMEWNIPTPLTLAEKREMPDLEADYEIVRVQRYLPYEVQFLHIRVPVYVLVGGIDPWFEISTYIRGVLS